MSLLDSIIGAATDALLKGDSGTQDKVSGLLSELFQQMGGLPGLIQKFQSSGLDDLIASWMGSGEKLPINQDQLQQVVGEDLLKNLADKAGLDAGIFGALLAKGLPKLVNTLTEQGEKAPEDVQDITLDHAKDLLGKIFS